MSSEDKIIQNKNNDLLSIHAKQIEVEDIECLNSSLSKKILRSLSEKDMYPKQIARYLNVHEQNVYYAIKKLEEKNFINVIREEKINGTSARFYSLTSPAYYFSLKDFEKTPKITTKESSFLKPFVENGKLNAIIIVGSPDPHGPQKARSKDGYFGMDLALFLGSYLNSIPESKVFLDTQISENILKENNLIVLGGPIVNKVTSLITETMPIYYDREKKGIYSTISKKTYYDEACGSINKFENPYNKEKKVLHLAGIRNAGTKAAILAFLKHFDKIQLGNSYDKKYYCNVVEGLDINSNGQVDDCEFLE